MSQFVEYAMKIKDMASGPLGGIANSFDRVGRHLLCSQIWYQERSP